MHSFYTPNITIADTEFVLSEEESKHCTKVLRMRAGEELMLLDGIGNKFLAQIQEPDSRATRVKIVQRDFDELPKGYIHLAVAPTKNTDRIEWLVEKLTELGVLEISLLDCTNSERSFMKSERLHKVAVSALKQSFNARLPIINPIIKFNSFINQLSNDYENKLIAHCSQNANRKISLKDVKPNEKTILLIGPEGDFTSAEIAFATSKGFAELSLGTNRLRTETAAMHACSVLKFLNEK
jgi:16S rRNA (uracil1498-N3)-methyltransferase